MFRPTLHIGENPVRADYTLPYRIHRLNYRPRRTSYGVRPIKNVKITTPFSKIGSSQCSTPGCLPLRFSHRRWETYRAAAAAGPAAAQPVRTAAASAQLSPAAGGCLAAAAAAETNDDDTGSAATRPEPRRPDRNRGEPTEPRRSSIGSAKPTTGCENRPDSQQRSTQ